MKSSPGTNRREFLRSAAAGGLLALAGPSGATASGAAELAAARARDIDAGRGSRLRMLLPEGSQSNVAPVAAAFEARTGIGIDLATTPVDDINAVLLLNRITGQQQYDVALPATFGIPDLAEAGALQPLDQWADAFEPAAFRNSSLYNIGDRYLGRLYGYQADGDVYLLFYNAAFLADPRQQDRYAETFGKPLELPATWQDIDRLLAFFHDPANGRYGGALFRTPRYIAWEWWMRLHSKGGLPFDADMRPTIDGDAGVAALEELTDASRFLCPGCSTNSLFQNWQAYARGNSFCNIGWGGSQKYFRRNAANFDRGLLYGNAPGKDASNALSYFNWGWNYAVPYNAAEPELGYLFALFASSASMSTLAVRQPDGFFDPFREEHYSDKVIRDVYDGEFLSAHLAAMRNAIPDLYLRGQSEYFQVLSDYIIQADRRLITPYAALQAVSNLWEDITDRLGRDEQLRQWRALRQQYPEAFRRNT